LRISEQKNPAWFIDFCLRYLNGVAQSEPKEEYDTNVRKRIERIGVVARGHDLKTSVKLRVIWLAQLAVLLLLISISDLRIGPEVSKQEQEFRSIRLRMNEQKQHGVSRNTRSAVYALVNIAAGTVIKPEFVATKNVDATEIPAGVVSQDDLHGTDADSWYLPKTEDAVGRISKGIRKGELLFFSYPGLRGRFVVVATRDIPDGHKIEKTSVEEKEINPCDMPVLAVPSNSDAIGNISTGILRGQIVAYERGRFGPSGRGGDWPGSNRERLPYVYAIKDIAKGSVITDADVRHSTYRSRGLTKGDPDIALYPVGRRVRSSISEGQIIANHDLIFEHSGTTDR
jgi:flagella basal body P-ring formation protein FlgA